MENRNRTEFSGINCFYKNTIRADFCFPIGFIFNMENAIKNENGSINGFLEGKATKKERKRKKKVIFMLIPPAQWYDKNKLILRKIFGMIGCPTWQHLSIIVEVRFYGQME